MTGNPRNAMVCDASYLQNEFSDPQFFYVFNLILSFSTCSESFEKICAWELLGTNVLKNRILLLLSYKGLWVTLLLVNGISCSGVLKLFLRLNADSWIVQRMQIAISTIISSIT